LLRSEVGCRAGEGREEKEIQQAVEKAAGNETRLYTDQSFRLVGRPSSDAMPDAAGGEVPKRHAANTKVLEPTLRMQARSVLGLFLRVQITTNTAPC
jgi:hypothetical protein